MKEDSCKSVLPFSKKQMTVFCWFMDKSPYRACDAIICDGAVRSGKTFCMSISFAVWATLNFNGAAFAMCGKTIQSLRRNIVTPILPALRGLGLKVSEKRSGNLVEISAFGNKNTFYLFGGRDESSASLIQGITLTGVMLDEVALMPRSFVEQAIARCSVDGSRLWFSCNPDHPGHWFHEEWIKKAKEKNCLYLHFTMEDNPSLSPEIISRYKKLYSGAFYERFVEGKWTAAHGCVYPMFDLEKHIKEPDGEITRRIISCDYGTVNPSSFGLWGECGGKWYRLREYYYDSKQTGVQRTDEEHYAALEELAAGETTEAVIVDPSAASFIECVRRHGRFRVLPAVNDVLDGIRKTGDMLREGKLFFSPRCKDIIREFSLYRWDDSPGRDSVKKQNDHAMDDMRYFVMTVEGLGGGFFALAEKRRTGNWD